MTRRVLALLPLLLAAAPAFAAAAPARDARALVDSVASRYRRMPFYRFEGVVHASASGAALPEPQTMEMPFRYAALRPSRLLNETQSPFMPMRTVADGESLRVWAPSLQQFTVAKAPVILPGAEPTGTAATLDPAFYFAGALARGVESARDVGADTVHTTAGTVRCRRVEVTYAADSARAGSRVLPRVLWIDEARGVVLRDSTTTDMEHPQYGALRQVQVARYVLADVGTPPPDSMFRFTPPEGAKRVRRLGQQEEPDALAGKPAKDFTLAVLDGKGRKVSLAAQRGTVVVLDFWATWCGPCRRWMPVVAKLEKETAGKGVKFFAVNLHEELADVREYVQAQKVAVPVLLDTDGAVGIAYGARSIPLTVIVGRDGKVVRSLVGVHPEDDLRDALREAGVAGL
jgi:thiol-disulfide isomerase/thioredoxin